MPNISSPMNYTTLNTYLQTLIVDQGPTTDYQTILPAVIQDAEQMIYRDMDFIATRTVDTTGALTIGARDFVLPAVNTIILVVQGVSIITPFTATFDTGKQVSLYERNLDGIDSLWPDAAYQAQPEDWCMKTDAIICVGPRPDQAYPVAITGTFRPASMSPSNLTSYIGNIYPDLLVNACMVFLAGYQRDYGQQSDDPKLAMSWQEKYTMALKSALSEEQRRKGQGAGWAPFSPTPEAAPPRT